AAASLPPNVPAWAGWLRAAVKRAVTEPSVRSSIDRVTATIARMAAAATRSRHVQGRRRGAVTPGALSPARFSFRPSGVRDLRPVPAKVLVSPARFCPASEQRPDAQGTHHKP